MQATIVLHQPPETGIPLIDLVNQDNRILLTIPVSTPEVPWPALTREPAMALACCLQKVLTDWPGVEFHNAPAPTPEGASNEQGQSS